MCVCFVSKDLYISNEKVFVLGRVRSTSSRLIAMLLDFEEKWEHGSKMKYKHGLSDCKA